MSFTVQRRNLVANPRAHVDALGWNTKGPFVHPITRSTYCPVSLPNGADAVFTTQPVSGGVSIYSDIWELPAGISSGNWVTVSFDIVLTDCDPEYCGLWADIEFYKGEVSQGWCFVVNNVPAPVENFVHYEAICQVTGEDADGFCVFLTPVDTNNVTGGSDYAVPWWTNVQVEPLPLDVDGDSCRTAWVEAYADGDVTGWEWDGLEHASQSHMTTPYEEDYDPVVAEDLTDEVVDNSLTLTVDECCVLCVEFGPAICNLLAMVLAGKGTVTPTGLTQVDIHGSQSFSFTAGEGHHLEDVKLDGVSVGTTSPYVLTDIVDHHHIHVYFARDVHTVQYVVSGVGGTLTGETEQSIEWGENATIVEAVPDPGYEFVQWDDLSTDPVRSEIDVLDDATYTATFQPSGAETFTVTYTAGSGGSIDGEATQTVEAGASSENVTALPDSGYVFDVWDDTFPLATRREDDVTENLAFEAQFVAAITYSLEYAAGAGGSLTGTVSQTVVEGEDGTAVTAVADPGYVFEKWSDDLLTVTRKELDVQAGLSVTASFLEIPSYTLQYAAGDGGSITGSAVQTVAAGANGTRVTATPDVGHYFASWSDGYPAQSRIATNVHADVDVTASFSPIGVHLKYYTCRHADLIGDVDQDVEVGGSGTEVTCSPHAGYSFVKWSDGVLTASRSDLNVTASKYLWARVRRILGS